MDTVVDMAKAIKIQAKDVNVFYGEKQALNNVSIDIEDRSVTAFIGPSGISILITLPYLLWNF